MTQAYSNVAHLPLEKEESRENKDYLVATVKKESKTLDELNDFLKDLKAPKNRKQVEVKESAKLRANLSFIDILKLKSTMR